MVVRITSGCSTRSNGTIGKKAFTIADAVGEVFLFVSNQTIVKFAMVKNRVF